jgi:hypothetical protein
MRSLLLAFVLLGACNLYLEPEHGHGSGSGPDPRVPDARGPVEVPVDAPTASSCATLASHFEAALADRGHCTLDQDCTDVGGQINPGGWTCDCAPAIGNCSGNAIERNAPGLALALQIATRYAAECAGAAPKVCDCAPYSALYCNPSGRCVESYDNSCFPPPPPPDAGVADAHP